MRIAVPRERRPAETRVAASPDTVKKFVGLGFEVIVEAGAGGGASIPDDAFREAGATVDTDADGLLRGADIVLKVARPMAAEDGRDEIALLKPGAILACHMQALTDKAVVEKLAEARVTAFAMELMPRITRAQSMDILSSQSNLAGYKAVLDAAATFNRAMPMMMTAAGTVPPARVLVLGAGVAGLQAIATAKRLGGVVYAFDVRPAVKEQVESLGGKFVEVDPEATKDAETAGGYAKEMAEDYKKKQAQAIHDQLRKADMAICTALIPGKPAPVLITDAMLRDMKMGSVVVDLAVEAGGNCEGSVAGEVVTVHGVTLIGHLNVPGRVAGDASPLFARNLFNFLSPMANKEAKGTLAIAWDDELVKGTCVCHDGRIVHPMLGGTPVGSDGAADNKGES